VDTRYPLSSLFVYTMLPRKRLRVSVLVLAKKRYGVTTPFLFFICIRGNLVRLGAK